MVELVGCLEVDLIFSGKLRGIHFTVVLVGIGSGPVFAIWRHQLGGVFRHIAHVFLLQEIHDDSVIQDFFVTVNDHLNNLLYGVAGEFGERNF